MLRKGCFPAQNDRHRYWNTGQWRADFACIRCLPRIWRTTRADVESWLYAPTPDTAELRAQEPLFQVSISPSPSPEAATAPQEQAGRRLREERSPPQGNRWKKPYTRRVERRGSSSPGQHGEQRRNQSPRWNYGASQPGGRPRGEVPYSRWS